MERDRVVYTGPFDPRLCDGVSRSMFDLLGLFRNLGHEVQIISFMHEGCSIKPKVDAISSRRQVEILSQRGNCTEFIMEGISIALEELPFSREGVLTSHPDVLTSYVKKIRKYPRSHFLTGDYDYTCLVAHAICGTTVSHFIHSPKDTIDALKRGEIYQQILKRRNVFTVSRYARGALWQEYQISSHVWPPVIDLSWVAGPATGSRQKAIGYYSAGVHKGDAIMDHLIRMMPDHQFLVMGDQSELHIRKPNVAFLGCMGDLHLFYENLSLLLVPSLIAEGYSRVVVEAAANGIPVIANRVGGIPEAIGDSGILVDVEPSAGTMADTYCGIIRELLHHPGSYAQYQEKARQRAVEYREEILMTSTDHIDKFFRS